MFGWTLTDNIATIAIDRAEARNAIPVWGWRDLAHLCSDVAASNARAVILRSEHPKIFSAGADIVEFSRLQSDPAARSEFREAMIAAMDAVARLPVPSIAAIDGGCYGAGVALVLACDIRIGGAGATFATTPAKLGLGYPGGDVARLSARVGKGFSAYMLFAGDAIDADTACRAGLVEMVAENAAAAAHALAARITGNVPDAVALLKRTIAEPDEPGLDAAFDARFASATFAERLAAFQDRKSR